MKKVFKMRGDYEDYPEKNYTFNCEEIMKALRNCALILGFCCLSFQVFAQEYGSGEEFKGGFYGAWDTQLSLGAGLNFDGGSKVSDRIFIPLQIDASYKFGSLNWIITPEIGISTRFFTQGLFADRASFYLGGNIGFRRFISITFWKDLGKTDSTLLSIDSLQVNLLLTKYFVKLDRHLGMFFDITLSQQTPSGFDTHGTINSVNLSCTLTNEYRTGAAGMGMLFFLSPEFWIDREGFMKSLIWE